MPSINDHGTAHGTAHGRTHDFENSHSALTSKPLLEFNLRQAIEALDLPVAFFETHDSSATGNARHPDFLLLAVPPAEPDRQ
jgi:hypothetical protein